MQADLASSRWERYWFQPSDARRLTATRVVLALVACCYFLSHLADAGWWFAADGVLDPQTTAALLGVGSDDSVARYRFSPMYFLGSPTALRLVLAAFAALAAVCALSASRLLVGLLYVAVLFVLHRGPMLAGLVEIPLCFGLLYLIIEPGASLFGRGAAAPLDRWTATVAARLVGLHAAGLLLMTVATQLAAEAWWNGEAAAYLALAPQSQPLDLRSLFASPIAASLATHVVLLLPLIGLGLWFFSTSPRYGKWVLSAYLATVVVIAGEFLYALSLMALVAGGLPADRAREQDDPTVS